MYLLKTYSPLYQSKKKFSNLDDVFSRINIILDLTKAFYEKRDELDVYYSILDVCAEKYIHITQIDENQPLIDKMFRRERDIAPPHMLRKKEEEEED